MRSPYVRVSRSKDPRSLYGECYEGNCKLAALINSRKYMFLQIDRRNRPIDFLLHDCKVASTRATHVPFHTESASRQIPIILCPNAREGC